MEKKLSELLKLVISDCQLVQYVAKIRGMVLALNGLICSPESSITMMQS